METTPYIWLNGKLIPWDDANVHVLTHALQYGSGVFEGLRFYETEHGSAIFRLEDHTKRLFYSASTLRLELPFTPEEINAGVKEVVAKSGIPAGYIRPVAFFGSGKMGLNPQGAKVEVAIACWPWGKYLPDRPLTTKVSRYIRIHPRSLVADAKVNGHYVNSILASQEVRGEGYDEAILLDYEDHVSEGPAENIFLVKDGVLATPKPGNILHGITRDSVMQIARDLGISVEERSIPE